MAEGNSAKPRPVARYLAIPDDGDPYLEGHKCGDCGAIFLGSRETCSSCGTSGKCAATRLSNHGELYVYSIVHRSFPGVDVPYVSAIVDLSAIERVELVGASDQGRLFVLDAASAPATTNSAETT